jgi:hypothetical protein
MHSRPARHAAHALAAASAPGHGGRVPKGSARFLRNEGCDRAWRCAVAGLDEHGVQGHLYHACPDVVPPRFWAARGAADARHPAPARAPSRAPGSGGRVTTRRLERLPPRPAVAPPGRLRPRTAWAGWARAARPLRLPRPRPDTTAAPAWRPREPSRRAWAAAPRVSVAAPAPQAYGGRRRQGGRRCPTRPGS